MDYKRLKMNKNALQQQGLAQLRAEKVAKT
jgi:hypothetical protein